jgi:small subunit ribosomal protein S8
MKMRLVEILKEEGYIDDFSMDEGDGIHREIIINIKYLDNFKTAINKMRRISKPGRRFYCKADDIPKVKAGLGVSIITTSKGIITDRDARRLNVGGEVLCEIW